MTAPVRLASLIGTLVCALTVRASADTECTPACKLGFDCVHGECVAEQCTPKCRSGFTCIAGECKSECEPACRSGYTCVHGVCKSPCNPPCASNERCTASGECVRLAMQTDDTESDTTSKNETPEAKPAEKVSTSSYKPSFGRVYVGPMILTSTIAGPLLTDPGGTVAIDAHVDDARVAFVGFRFGAWGDTSGAMLLFDLDLGLRPRLWANADAGVSLAIGGGVGLAYFTSAVALFHMPLRVGPCFDFGAFTLEVVVGPALYAARNAVGAFEGIAELGVRFGG